MALVLSAVAALTATWTGLINWLITQFNIAAKVIMSEVSLANL